MTRRRILETHDIAHLGPASKTRPALMRLKVKIDRAEQMVDRHGWRTRRGAKWYNASRKMDRQYRALWKLFPASDTLSEFEFEGQPIKLRSTFCPISGFRKRMAVKWSAEAMNDFKTNSGQDLMLELQNGLATMVAVPKEML